MSGAPYRSLSFFFFSFSPIYSMQDPSFLTRDWTCAPWVLTTGSPGKFLSFSFLSPASTHLSAGRGSKGHPLWRMGGKEDKDFVCPSLLWPDHHHLIGNLCNFRENNFNIHISMIKEKQGRDKSGAWDEQIQTVIYKTDNKHLRIAQRTIFNTL